MIISGVSITAAKSFNYYMMFESKCKANLAVVGLNIGLGKDDENN